MDKESQKIIIVLTKEKTTDYDKNEIIELFKTANAEILCFTSQKRAFIDPNTVVGKGKLDEIKELIYTLDADLVYFDSQLTSLQRRNIEKILNCDVIDKIDLILDIFAQRAQTAEGKKQVELAQLMHNLANKSEKNFSRQQGGIGSRGPGETQLETDKRRIRQKITQLKGELLSLEKQRKTMRTKRQKSNSCLVALVGYTNAGKSTLFNLLTNNSVYADNKLFATLDTTTRKMKLPCGIEILLTDTVGFIKDLPHDLIEAFKSTLEETVQADILLNVCDISSGEADSQTEVTRELLRSLKADKSPMLNVLNKCDLVEGELPICTDDCVLISAATGYGIDEMLRKLSKLLPPSQIRMNLLIPYSSGGLSAEIRESGKIFSEEFTAEGTLIDALVDVKILHKLEKYQVVP